MANIDPGRLLVRALGRRLPRLDGTLAVPGLPGDVRVRRDRWGIPHIDAGNGLDAWYGLGFCHAQDRAFQLETLLRVGRGTLAELVGPEGLPLDRTSRRLGFARLARAQRPMIGQEVRDTMEAYAAGVNAGLRHGLARRPHEFVLLRAQPSEWTVEDVLAFVALQAFSLAGNWDAELARLRILASDGADALLALDPAYAPWLPVTSPIGALADEALARTADRLAADLALLGETVGLAGGSNNWAIAGSRTASGAAIVANDPHLPPRLPVPWYLAHLRTPDWELAGASFVGGPAFPIGTNGHIAWGITAGLTDTVDLFLEEVGPGGASVRRGDGFVPCEVVHERIAVRGGSAEELSVLVTERGPVLTAAFESGPGETASRRPEHDANGAARWAFSFAAPWLRPAPLRGFLDVAAARTFESFRSAFAEWPGPALNVVYGDVDGHVGWQLIGTLPRRRGGFGTLPLPGWDPGIGWEDEPVPFAEMPHVADPEAGFVVTANNQPSVDGDAPFLGIDWMEGYRVARLLEVLGGETAWTVPKAQALQRDVVSLPWRELRDLVLGLPVPPGEEAARAAIALLQAWDGRVAVDSVGASVYELFAAAMSRRIAEARAPGSWRTVLGEGYGVVVPRTMFATRHMARLVRLLRDRPEGWFAGSSWEAEAIGALGDIMRFLRDQAGPDPAGWAWGRLRQLTFEHPIGARRPFDRVFNLGPIPYGGDTNTPMQASSGPLSPFENPAFTAETRCVMDLGNPSASRFALAGGESGNPLSPHYGDLFELWQRGEGVPIPMVEAEIAAAAVHTLTLRPATAPR
jgi:penicillin amidase